MTAGSSVTYPGLMLQPLPSASSGSETVTLSTTAPTGLSLTLQRNSVELSSNVEAFLGMTINASQSVAPGLYNFTVLANYGTSSTKYGFTVNVVKYLVVTLYTTFVPGNLTVTQGSTVYWINLDYNNQYPENVVFASGALPQSPGLSYLDTYSYTFTTPGTYPYSSPANVGMVGTITVTANG
jgi:plastocyanin